MYYFYYLKIKHKSVNASTEISVKRKQTLKIKQNFRSKQ